MALRYWVGGTNTWNATAGTKWSATSGGAGGASVPTTADDVFFDANSGNAATVVTLGINTSVLSINFTGYVGTFTFGGSITVSGTVTLGTGTTYTTSGAVTTYSLNASATGMTLVSNGKILPVNFSTNGGTTTINGNADFQGNFTSTSVSHNLKSATGVPADLRIGGNISLLALVTNTTDTVTFKAYGTAKTFASNGASSNAIVSFVSGSTYTNTAVNVGISGTSFLTVESGGRFNAFNNIASFTTSGTVTLSGFNSTNSSDFMSITAGGAFILSNDTVIKGFINIAATCAISTSTGAKILLEGNLTSVNNAALTIDYLEFSGTTLSTVSASTSAGNLQIKNISFNKTGAGSVNITSSFGLAVPTATTYTWTHTAGTITQSVNSRIFIINANATSTYTYSESISLSTPFTFSSLTLNGGALSLNSTLRATRLFLTLGVVTTSITSSGTLGFIVDVLSVVNTSGATRTVTLKSGVTYAINTQLYMSATAAATTAQITLNASVVSGTRAYFELDNNATQLVEYVSATDIDSSGTLNIAPFTKQLIYSLSGTLTRTSNWSTGSQPPPVLPSRTVAYTFVN
jgi:hypothetical protein